MAQDSQEKNLPATQQKLKKGREKGQVASSQDFVSAVVTVAIFVWLLVEGSGLLQTIVGIYRQAAEAAASGSGFHGDMIHRIFADLFWKLAELMGAGVFAGVFANIAHKGGIVFSITPLMPDLSRISPSAGFKRMFGKRHLTSLGISLTQISIWSGCVAFAFWSFAPALLNAPVCGPTCVLNTGGNALWWLIVVALAIIVVAGVIDLPIQIFLFRHDMRMSYQERRQEMKDMEGAPEFDRQRRALHQAQLRSGSNIPTVVITSSSCAVALRFHPDSTPVPMVTAKGWDQHGDSIIAAAKRLGVPVWPDPELARRLMKSVQIGMAIPTSEFGAVAPHILRSPSAALSA